MSSDEQVVAGRPPVVDQSTWHEAVAELRVREKALTRAHDELNAARRALPMTPVASDYRFQTLDGERTLLDLFDGRHQLIVYHFMFGADWDEGCAGCSWVVDAMSHPAHLEARDTSIVVVSLADLDRLEAYRKRMGWSLDWCSSAGSTFNVDMGATVDGDEHHGVSVFFRDGVDVFRTWFTVDRGVEHLGSHWTYLDLTPFGRQEQWEHSPPDWPQHATHSVQRRHDDYEQR